MKQLLVICSCLLLAFMVYMHTASAYVPPQRNLVIVEVDQSGAPIEKKVAEKADLFFSREMKTAALFGVGGITDYRATFTLNLQNVAGERLESVSLIETIPKELAEKAALIESDENFLVLEPDPVIKFSLAPIAANESKRVSYKIRFSAQEMQKVESAFRQMSIPTALIPISEEDCTGIICNDFNPCTEDYCAAGKCVYSNAAEGLQCEEGKVCVQGSCEKFKHSSLLFTAAIVIIAIAALSALLLHKARKKR